MKKSLYNRHGWEKNENRYERIAYDSNGSEKERTATGMKENATGRKQRTLWVEEKEPQLV